MTKIKSFIELNKKELICVFLASLFFSIINSLYADHILNNWIKNHNIGVKISGIDFLIVGNLTLTNTLIIFPTVLGIIILNHIQKKECYLILVRQVSRLDLMANNMINSYILTLLFMCVVMIESLIFGCFNSEKMINYNLKDSYFFIKNGIVILKGTSLFNLIVLITLALMLMLLEINLIHFLYLMIKNKIIVLVIYIVAAGLVLSSLSKNGFVGNGDYRFYLLSNKVHIMIFTAAIALFIILINSIIYAKKDFYN